MDEVNWNADKVNSISSASGRIVIDGERAVEVHADSSSKTQIAALMDLLDLHLSNVDAGEPVDPTHVTLRVPKLTAEAQGALGTIHSALEPGVHVEVLEHDSARGWIPATIGWDIADVSGYGGWPALLGRSRPVPAAVSALVLAVERPSLRAYPRLSTVAGWSIRLEGLEVGHVTKDRITLTVGNHLKHGPKSLQRRVWTEATGLETPLVTTDVGEAANHIATFAKAWQHLESASSTQDEHALESRILRGATTVVANGNALDLIQPDPVVNWGSQFPTKWGLSGKPRYLDALLRDGSTPWAIEIKVQGGAGVGQYYRHAVAQAVLYREFIRRAVPLHSWFETRGLEPTQCQAAVVVPRLTNPKHAHWRDHVVRLCAAFDVAFVEVDPEHALRY